MRIIFIALLISIYTFAQEKNLAGDKFVQKRIEEETRYIKKAIAPFKTSLLRGDYISQMQLREKFRECVHELRSRKTLSSSTYSVLRNCKKQYQAIDENQLQRLRRYGLESPLALDRELERIDQENKEHYQNLLKEDKIIIEDMPIMIVKSESNDSINDTTGVLQQISPFKSILIELNKSNKLQDLPLQNDLSADVTMELSRLLSALESVKRFRHECKLEGEQVVELENSTDKRKLLNKRLVNQATLAHTTPLEIFFSLPESQLKQIKAFEIVSEGKKMYLFKERHHKGNQNNWLMAYYDEDSNLQYRSYKTALYDLPMPKHDNEIKIINYLKLTDRLRRKNPSSKLLFNLEVGLSLSARSEKIPFTNEVLVPTENINIGTASVVTKTDKLHSSTNLHILADETLMESTVGSSKSNNFSISGAFRYKNFENKWRTSLGARYKRINFNYLLDHKGEDFIATGYTTKKSFIGHETNFKGINKIKVGTQLKNNKGGVYASFNMAKRKSFDVLFLYILD